MLVRAINTPPGHMQFRDLGTSAVKELLTNSKFLLFFLNNQKILLVKRVYKMCGRPLNIHEVNLRVSNKLVIFLKFTKFLLASHVISDVNVIAEYEKHIYVSSTALSGCQPHFRQLIHKKMLFEITRIRSKSSA